MPYGMVETITSMIYFNTLTTLTNSFSAPFTFFYRLPLHSHLLLQYFCLSMRWPKTQMGLEITCS